MILVSETLKRLLPVSETEKRFPLVVPLVPILILNKSPVAVVALPGDQSKEASFPLVRPVEVVVTSRSVPDVSVFAALESWSNFPCVIEVEEIYAPVPVVSALSMNAKADVVVVPVATLEVNV